MKRYQVYLNPQTVGVFDEIALVGPFTRSKIIREALDGAAGRIGNIMAAFVALKPESYSELDKMTDSIDLKTDKKVNISQNVDEIYYR